MPGGARPPGRRCGWRLPTSSVSEPQEQRWHRLHDHVVHGLRGAGHCTSPMRTTSTRPGPMCHVLATRASPVAYVARSRVRGWIERVEFRSGAVAGRPPGGSEGLLSSSAQSGDPGPARRGCAGRVPGTRIRNTGRAKTGPRDATRFPQIRRRAGWPACIGTLVVRAAFRFVTVPVRSRRQIHRAGTFPSKMKTTRQNYRAGSRSRASEAGTARLRTRTRVSMIVPTAATA